MSAARLARAENLRDSLDRSWKCPLDWISEVQLFIYLFSWLTNSYSRGKLLDFFQEALYRAMIILVNAAVLFCRDESTNAAIKVGGRFSEPLFFVLHCNIIPTIRNYSSNVHWCYVKSDIADKFQDTPISTFHNN